ncbi:MAG: SLC13 family permease [Dehalococcoidia bacterium]|nr:SLC13 family permease [Dehalococcoidia bacterium]
MLTAAIILILTYIGIAFTRLPWVNVDRSSAAFTGGVLMVLFGVLTFDEAVRAVDFNTITLLLGMMVLVAALKEVGFFDLLAAKSLSLARTPRRLLLLVIIATAVSSAFLVNDTVVLLFTPIVIHVCRHRRVNPVPYLIAEAMASNIGSTATIVGNPQNMLIGITSGISFARFFLYLLPVSVVSTVALILIMYAFYRKTFSRGPDTADEPVKEPPTYDARALRRLLPILLLVLIAFFLSSFLKLSIPLIALSAAALVLLAAHARPSSIIREVDWVLLLFFAGLFVVIEGAHRAGVLDVFIERVTVAPDLSGIASVSIVSTLVSQIVSNVPLTMLLLPMLKNVPGDVLWIALASGSTLGGNLTIIGAVANIIVVEGASRDGVHVGFFEFLKVGAVVTAVTIGLSIMILGAEYWLGWLR